MNIPNGSYPALWSAYVVEVKVKGELVKLSTTIGVRGFDIPVTASYTDGVWTVHKDGRDIPLKT